MNDLISRQALCEYALNQKDKSVTPNDIMRFPSAQSEQQWHPITEIPPFGKDLMLKLHDRRHGCDCFYYYDMGFYDGDNYQTYLFWYQDDHDLEVVGWQLCPWRGEQE